MRLRWQADIGVQAPARRQDASAQEGTAPIVNPKSVVACDQISISRLGSEIISSFSFEFRDGAYALVGGNGTGKSTFLKMLAGLLRPTSGRLKLGSKGKEPSVAEIKRSTFFVPDCRSFPGQASVKTMIRFCDAAYGVALVQRDKAASVFESLEIEDLLKYRIHELSFGMRTRLFLYCALRVNPGILLLDEPFNGLDGAFSQIITDHLLNAAASSVVVLSTHEERPIEELGAYVLPFPLH